MNKITNLHMSPIVLRDNKTGASVYIHPGKSELVSGDFSNHLFVKQKMMKIEPAKDVVSTNDGQGGGNLATVAELRVEYESLFEQPADSKLNKATLIELIDKEKERLAKEVN